MKIWEIDLNNFRNSTSRVFTGKDKGVEVRRISAIDEFVETYDRIRILVPKDILSISPSFLEGFLFNIVKKLGRYKFYEKINFINSNINLSNDLEEAIDRISRVVNYQDNQVSGTKITRLKNIMTPVINYFALVKRDRTNLSEDQVIGLTNLLREERERIQELLPEIRKILSEIPNDACKK